MSRHSLILALLAVLPVSLAADGSCSQPAKRWFVLAGQSNMVGWSDQVTPISTGVSFRHDEGTIQEQRPLLDPLVFFADATRPTNQSAWPEFARHFKYYTGRWPRFISTAVGATCLSPSIPVGPWVLGNWDPDTGDLYPRTLEVWQAAGEPELRAFLWLQGECEAITWETFRGNLGESAEWQYQQSYDDYYALLSNLADRVAVDFGTVLMAAPISLMMCSWGNESCDPDSFQIAEHRRGVHDAIITAAADHPNIVLGPYSDDLRSMPDGVHTWDVNTLGARWAQAVK